MSETETCPERVWRGGDYSGAFVACGKPVKRDGACGRHANANDRRAQRKAEDDRTDAASKAARDLALTMSQAGYDARGDSRGIRLDTEVAERLMRDLTTSTGHASGSARGGQA